MKSLVGLFALIIAFLTGATLASCSVSRGGANPCITNGPAEPSVAAAAGLETLVFWDDFANPATIDGGNTQAPGFNWYGSWTKRAGGKKILVSSANYSVSNSILHLNSETDAGGYALQTWAATGWAPNTFVGRSFAPPLYYEAKIAVNKSLAPGSVGPGQDGNPSRFSWPTIWLQDITLMSAILSGGSISQSYGEIDVLEFYVGTTGMGARVWDQQANVHIWNSTTTISPDSTNHVNWGTTWDDTTFHTVGVLVTSASAKFYFDGTLMQTISLAGGMAPAFNSSYVLLINPGYGTWPTHVDYVGLWQHREAQRGVPLGVANVCTSGSCCDNGEWGPPSDRLG